jgi:hypothetical protein
LVGFEVLDLAVCDPLRAALEIGAEEVADAIGVFEALDVDGEGRENLEYAVEEHPAAKACFSGCRILEISGHLELLELVDKGGAWCGC